MQGPTDLPRRNAGATPRWVISIVIGIAAAVILAVMNPLEILRANTPTGGDMGAHVYGPAFLRDVLLPNGRIMGWSNGWFAGFPAFYFYFPLPSLVIVALDLVLPYGVAFKVVTVLGLLALPLASYYLARCLGFSRLVAGVTGGSAAAFVFMESFSIYGGNIASTLAGEFSFGWSFAFSLVYLGLLVKAVRDDRKYLPWAALFLGLTALSHVITTIVVVIASLPVLMWKRGFKTASVAWIWGFAVAAFWALPLLAAFGYSSDMAWNPLQSWKDIVPIEIWLLLPIGFVGLVWSLRRTSRVVPVITLTLLPLIYYPLPTFLPELLPNIFPGDRWKLWNGRLLPYWYYGVGFFAALAIGLAAGALARRLPDRISRWVPRTLAAVAIGVLAWTLYQTPEAASATTNLVLTYNKWFVGGLIVVALGGIAFALVPGGSKRLRSALWPLAVVAVVGIAALVFATGSQRQFSLWIAIVGTVLLALSLIWTAPVSSRSVIAITAGLVLVFGGIFGVSFVDGWARWNYEGYEGKTTWPEYEGLMATVAGLPEGRVHWEANSELNQYGTPMSLMLFPYWSDEHPSQEGLFFESSITTQFHFINSSNMSSKPPNPIPGLKYDNFEFDLGLQRLDLYGVEYYVAFTDEAKEEAGNHQLLTLAAESPPFQIYSLPPSDLVEVASFQPAVYESSSPGFVAKIGAFVGSLSGETSQPSFHDFALEWYDESDNREHWVTAGGPEEWPRVVRMEDIGRTRPLQVAGEVSDIEIDHGRVSFKTTAIGVPHLVKVSYFPNWEASGAEGPWRATPSLMVVVPTEEEVVLTFTNTWAETGGMLLSVVGLVILVSVLSRSRRAARSDTE